MTETIAAVCKTENTSKAQNRREDIYRELDEILPEKINIDSGAVSRAINGYLKELSKSDRQVFLARYYYGMELSAIAEVRQTSGAAVKAVLSETRSGLKSYIERSVTEYERK